MNNKRSKFVTGLSDEKKQSENSTVKSDNGRMCFCTYGPNICNHDAANWTCVKHPNAACFHLMEEIYNPEIRSMETLHSFGCAPLEKGSDASHLTCNAWRSSHAKPKSIACCYEGDYCNKFITPPPYVNPPIEHEDESGLAKSIPVVFACLFATVFLLWLLFIIGWLIYRFRVYRQTGKWRWMTGRSMNSGRRGEVATERAKMLQNFETSLSSGTGAATLIPRTIGRDTERLQLIGRGRYGDVWKGRLKGSFVAVKSFCSTDEHSWRNETEIYETNMLNHENILRWVGRDIVGINGVTEMWLIMDFHEHGSLHDYLRRNDQALKFREALQLAHSAISGIAHLHGQQIGSATDSKPEIAHRDIKSKNILVKRPGISCIADFGLAIRYYSRTDEIKPSNVNIQVGTKRYMAPEVLAKTLNPKDFNGFKCADIYSFALVLWELARRIEDGVSMSCTNVSSLSKSSIPSDPVAHSPSPSLSQLAITKQTDETTTSKSGLPYEPPFEGMVDSDPTLVEMKKIVCDQNRRPPLQPRWTENKGTPLQQLADLMDECWKEKPNCRHTALFIKQKLSDFIGADIRANGVNISPDNTYHSNMGTGSYHHKQLVSDVESGFRSKTQS